MAATAAVILFGWHEAPRAETTVNSTEREKLLEQRVNYLEDQLRRIEKLLSAAQVDKPASHPASVRASAKQAVQPVTAGGPSPGQRLDTPTNVAGAEAVAPAPSRAAEPPPPGTGAPDDAPQELNILRENAVTLKPAGFEISNEIDYIERQTSLQRDRAILSTTSLRYGLLDWLELSAVVPFGYSTRVSDTSPVSAATQHVSGIGDLTLQANARLVDQTANWPGIVLSLGAIAPTGANPYDFSHYSLSPIPGLSTPNPRNPLADYFTQGSWAVHSNLQFYKTVDPIILFLGFGADRVFPVTVSGYTVDGYTRLSYNLGFSFALSEKTTLGFSVNGTYSPDLRVNGHDVFQSATEPTVARLSAIQRIMKNVYLEPSISFGLDQDAPDFILGVGLRARF